MGEQSRVLDARIREGEGEWSSVLPYRGNIRSCRLPKRSRSSFYLDVSYPSSPSPLHVQAENCSLSWSDTTASTIGRLWGKHTPPLPAHLPFVPAIRFAPRKSLAGFLAATITGVGICMGFWWNGSEGKWAVLDGSWAGLGITAGVVGVGGAVVEALGESIAFTGGENEESIGCIRTRAHLYFGGYRLYQVLMLIK